MTESAAVPAVFVEAIEPRVLLFAPNDPAGWNFEVTITSSSNSDVVGGVYELAFTSGSNGQRYTRSAFSGFPSSSGVWTYTRSSNTQGNLELFDTFDGLVDTSFVFATANSGAYSNDFAAGGFSTGTFTVVDRPAGSTPPPNPIISNLVGDHVAVVETTLFVSGFDFDDDIYIERQGSELLVLVNNNAARVRADAIGLIEIAGRDGNDTLAIGGDIVAVRMSGGHGNDLLFGGDGGDELHGKEGNDYVFGGDSGDLLRGNAGDDTLSGGGGPNTLFGGAGEDRVNGSGSRDLLYGEEDDDRLYGFGGNDTLDGGGGVDRLFGDELGAVGGDDLLIGGGSNDKLYARGGNDTLIGNRGRDLFAGGDGFDTAIFDSDDDTDNPDLVSGIEASA